MRTPSIPWEEEKATLLDFRARGFSLTKINGYLFEKYGKGVTNARLSQVFTAWKNQDNEPEPFRNALGEIV